jgi:selenocysteine lyase/cysteine desulfurase
MQARSHDGETALLDELRHSDFARLDAGHHAYLDYTGAGLYADSQLSEHIELLRTRVFGNPHSLNPTSSAMTELVEHARDSVLDYFRASPQEYVAIFTPNATGALRLVGEAYPFRSGDRFLLTFDNHNSVNGIREFARARGAETTYVPSEAPDLRVDEELLPRYLTEVAGRHHNLFAYPAQSNFSGVQHPLEWVQRAQAHGWDVLLDAAAYVPTNRLDLSRWHPDFVALSFYKMFGWPTGIGCLLARRTALAKLERPWFSGGTIVAAFVQREWYQSAPGAAHFEDGTLNFLNLPAVEIGLRFLDRIGIEAIHARVETLGRLLLDTLGSVRHTNGAPAATIYGPRDFERRGATIAFNFLHPTAVSSTSATSTASPDGTTSRSAPAASATRAPAKSPSPSPARRSSAESSAKGWRSTTTSTRSDSLPAEPSASRSASPRTSPTSTNSTSSHASSSTSASCPTTCHPEPAADRLAVTKIDCVSLSHLECTLFVLPCRDGDEARLPVIDRPRQRVHRA